MAINRAGHNISLISDYLSLTGDNRYPPDDDSLGVSTTTGHPSASKAKQATSIITQEFNTTLKKERESNASALSERATLKVRMSEIENTMALMNQKLT